MTLGLACAFLLGLVALLLRVGIPRAAAQTLATAKWLPLGFAAMFALLALIAAGSAGASARIGWASVVRQLSELNGQPAGALVLVEAQIAAAMLANEQGWVAWDPGDGPKTSHAPLRVTFPDGDLDTLGSDYDGVSWNVQRSIDAPSYYYLLRGDAVTLQGSGSPAGFRVTHAHRGHRAANVAHKARMEYWSCVATAVVAGASTLGVPGLLVFALRRRRRALGP